MHAQPRIISALIGIGAVAAAAGGAWSEEKNPNAVIILGPDYTGPDGLSRMPSYNDTLTVTQLADLVAYLTSLTGDHGHHAAGSGHEAHGAPQTAQAAGSAAAPDATVFNVAIADRKLASPDSVIRVQQGQAVEFRWTTDEAAELHLHGYDLKTVVKPGAPATVRFTARAAGRFPVTVHRFGDPAHPGHGAGHGTEHGKEHAKAHGHEEMTLLYLEVHPR